MATREPKPGEAPPDDGGRNTADREKRKAIIGAARNFLVHLGSLVRQLAVHNAQNSAVQTVLLELNQDMRLLERLVPHVAVVFAEGHMFMNGVWVRSTGRAWESSVFLTETLRKLHARGVRFDRGVGPNNLLSFTTVLRRAAAERNPADRRSEDVGVDGVRLVLREEIEAPRTNARAEFREVASELFREGLVALDRAQSRNLDVFLRRRQRSLVLRLVQLAEDSPEDLLILTTVRDPTLNEVAHNLMVTILSISIGRLIDLKRRDLLRLGVNALTHNLGESLLPDQLVHADRSLTDEELAVMKSHPLLGMSHVFTHFGYEVPMVERAVASAEHHISPDGSGYPEIGLDSPHAFSRIISVADAYTAMVSDRPQRVAYPPDQAMKLLVRQSGRQLDRVISKTFVRLVGRYPPGSLVELDTGEFALVIGPGAGRDPLTRPRVLLLTDEQGKEREVLTVVDLGERHEKRRAWMRTIVRTRDPRRLAAPVSRYLFADREEAAPLKLDANDESLQRRGRKAATGLGLRSATGGAEAVSPRDQTSGAVAGTLSPRSLPTGGAFALRDDD